MSLFLQETRHLIPPPVAAAAAVAVAAAAAAVAVAAVAAAAAGKCLGRCSNCCSISISYIL